MVKRKKRVKKTSKKSDFDFVPNHILVPKHTKASEKEKKFLIEHYYIDVSELPKMFTDDPAIQHLELKPGDVVKIIRKSPTAGESVFFRAVVEGI